MAHILSLLALGIGALAHAATLHELIHSRAERDYNPAYLSRATGDLRTRSKERYSWPVKVLSIGHTIGSYQCYTGSASSAYFHHGLDIRANAAQEVTASVGGKVINVENYEPGDESYWEVAILDDEGFIWQYHHIDSRSIPTAIHQAFKNGTKIATGAKLGEVVYWPVVAMGERYHHIHVNVIGKDQRYLSAFDFLDSLGDAKAPEIVELGLYKNGKKVNGNVVTAPYSLYLHSRDLILHDRFYVPPHEIWLTVDGGMKQLFWKFDALPGGASKTQYVNQFYLLGLTCGNYECRKPVVDLGFMPGSKTSFPSTKGAHSVLVEIKDADGNAASKEFSWTVE